MPNSVNTLGYGAFQENKLSSVAIPDSVTTIESDAFSLQSPLGASLEDCVASPDACLWSADPAVVQAAYDQIRYAALYTVTPSNPNNLKSAYQSEAAYAGSDLNQNGTKADSLGGHLINPASVTLRYVSDSNAVLQTELTLVGNNLTTNLSADGPDIPQPVDVYNPTAAEQQAIDASLTNYYHIGQTVSFTPLKIAGYTVICAWRCDNDTRLCLHSRF